MKLEFDIEEADPMNADVNNEAIAHDGRSFNGQRSSDTEVQWQSPSTRHAYVGPDEQIDRDARLAARSIWVTSTVQLRK